jgi:hypothetical protein
MARIIRFHYPLSYRPANKPRHAQGTRGKLVMFPPVAYRPPRPGVHGATRSGERVSGNQNWVS